MKRRLVKLADAAAWVWRHVAAGVAVVLILLALAVGYWFGSQRDGTDARVAAAGENAQADAAEAKWYTCSMHPTVRVQDPSAKCPICFMDLIPVTDGGGAADPTRLVMSDRAMRLADVETSAVARLFPEAEVRLYGTLAEDQTRLARVTAYAAGRLERLYVNYVGIPVSEGDHIAELYSPELLAAVEELRQSGASLGQVGEASELVRESTRRTLEASRQKLRLLGLSVEQVERLEREGLEGDLLTISSPIAGVVTERQATEGEYVKVGDPIVTVADLSRQWLELEAAESQLPLLRWGQPVTFRVKALPGELFEGQVAFIEPLVGQRTRTAKVRVTVRNEDGRLKPGMVATATVHALVGERGAVPPGHIVGKWVSPMHPEIVKDGPGQCDVCGMDLVPAEELMPQLAAGEAEPPLVVPRGAVLWTGDRAVVYVRVPDEEAPTFELRDVALGPRAGPMYVVRSGLQEGERVVSRGAFRIDSAMQLAGKHSMLTREGGSGHVHGPMGAPPAGAAAAPDVPATFVRSLTGVYDASFAAQEALADDSLEGFLDAHEQMHRAVERVAEPGVGGEALEAWRRARRALAGDAPGDIEAARASFEAWSIALIALHDAVGHAGDEVWRVATCPMAFDFKGADWMQRGEVIDNPYFGESMLRCGEIRRELAPTRSAAPAVPAAEQGGHGRGAEEDGQDARATWEHGHG